ncbi:hypothetical protein AYI70_g2901 [Smittium culicis]|uniref:Uncharacterized protein n=1 Tax=Smittium culicis TaxID=133412 RepID=A0A1R1Y5Y6_9FUNG|nr:hypothetical protein AYI70_g2901 [Smittium culicis]
MKVTGLFVLSVGVFMFINGAHTNRNTPNDYNTISKKSSLEKNALLSSHSAESNEKREEMIKRSEVKDKNDTFKKNLKTIAKKGQSYILNVKAIISYSGFFNSLNTIILNLITDKERYKEPISNNIKTLLNNLENIKDENERYKKASSRINNRIETIDELIIKCEPRGYDGIMMKYLYLEGEKNEKYTEMKNRVFSQLSYIDNAYDSIFGNEDKYKNSNFKAIIESGNEEEIIKYYDGDLRPKLVKIIGNMEILKEYKGLN